MTIPGIGSLSRTICSTGSVEGHEAAAVSPSLRIYAALFAAVCIGAAPAPDTSGGKSSVMLAFETLRCVAVYEIDQQALAARHINLPATILSLSGRAPKVPPDAARGARPERSVSAFLRAIQTMLHLALKALASLSRADRAALTVRANGADAGSMPGHAV